MTERPVLRIVRGEPTPEELAIVTAMVSAFGGDSGAGGEAGHPSASAAAPRGRWNDPAHQMRQPMRQGLGAWRATLR